MRMMLKVQIPVEAGNKRIQDGSLGRTIQQTLEVLHPEAAYFFPDQGKRAMLMVFDLKDPSQLPPIVEPLFTGLNAEITLTPVMNAEDLQAGLGQVAQKR